MFNLINFVPISIPSIWGGFDDFDFLPSSPKMVVEDFKYQDGMYSLLNKVDKNIKPSDIEISVDDNVLTVKTEIKSKTSHLKTLSTYTIPSNADTDSIDAELTDEGLLITMSEI